MPNILLLRKAGRSQLVGRAYLKAVSEGSTTAHATSRTSLATLVRSSLQKVYTRKCNVVTVNLKKLFKETCCAHRDTQPPVRWIRERDRSSEGTCFDALKTPTKTPTKTATS